MKTVRLTMAQALLRFLDAQYVERDGVETKFVRGVGGIFGHGNVVGLGEALAEGRHGLHLLPGTQRAGRGAHGHRLCQAEQPPPDHRRDQLHRPGRPEHGDRRGGAPA